MRIYNFKALPPTCNVKKIYALYICSYGVTTWLNKLINKLMNLNKL